jgi:hypothetical protein
VRLRSPVRYVCELGGHAHEPAAQTCDPLQVIPQPPQLLVLVEVSVQTLLQLTPVLHFTPQNKPSQVAVAPAGAVHGVHDNPHVATAMLLTQTPLQSCWPSGQAHNPSRQLFPALQVRPQPPQLLLSEPVSRQTP